ncbi:hypothetical protein G6321_00025300 [Bradyrhizobium barranii subsp. barranii]|uniref:Uncharacterized protein n=1 Tax=Bradyrhizobium barranii subsp. barranii TaxID=2823807 RepID=A0A7Z0QJP3_9BRAD|nr:hypothetical protein [Bradyrhizobium barranii]UEM17314.1 hypothetical protein J4G43_025630 [Bradyrhizobium barranii subsp. barranii]UGX98263.1 hypothetical protein G6321_00025300 [Bradyrhizobium barranii subsp. barranii]
MDDDLLSWAMLGTVLLSLGITTIVTAELMPDVQTYRKARVLHAGDNFRPVMLTVVHR